MGTKLSVLALLLTGALAMGGCDKLNMGKDDAKTAKSDDDGDKKKKKSDDDGDEEEEDKDDAEEEEVAAEDGEGEEAADEEEAEAEDGEEVADAEDELGDTGDGETEVASAPPDNTKTVQPTQPKPTSQPQPNNLKLVLKPIGEDKGGEPPQPTPKPTPTPTPKPAEKPTGGTVSKPNAVPAPPGGRPKLQ